MKTALLDDLGMFHYKPGSKFFMAAESFSSNEIAMRLVALIPERLLETGDGFTADSDLYENGLDSMAIMQLLVLIEEEFGVAIPESELTRENFRSARRIAEVLSRRRNAAGGKQDHTVSPTP